MLSKGIRKYASNPVIGLLPFIIYIIGYSNPTPPVVDLSISLALGIIGELLARYIFKSRIFSATFHISIAALLMTLIIWLFTKNLGFDPTTYILFCEIITVGLFILLRISKTYINTHIFKHMTLLEKVLVDEFHKTAAVLQYLFTFHLFLILIDRQLKTVIPGHHSPDRILFTVIPLCIIVGVIIGQLLNVRRLSKKLRKEEWLPIVTEKGEVTGRIAKSVSLTMKNRFLHPIVRVVLISNGKVFLQERPETDILSPRKLDYPFEKYMLFSHEINLAARNSIRQMMDDNEDLPIRFLLKYVFENEDTKRLIFLFIAEVPEEDMIRRSAKMTGKFWSVKQIEEGFIDEIFSECFELEFEYLKNMVLLPSENFNLPE